MIKLAEHADLSRETMHRRLAENEVKSHGARTCGASPRSMAPMSPVWRMCSTFMPRRPKPGRPAVCFDESPTQLICEVRQPIAASPGQLEQPALSVAEGL